MYCPVCQSEYPADWKACPKDATALLKSAHIGKYQIEGMLGVGGMGAVYKATNPDIKGSRVAIKVMNPAIAGAEQIRERFKREAAAVAALRTSHVVKVYDFNAEPDGTLYLVMELLDGHALRDEITPAPAYMDLARVQMVMEGALKGLAAAHKVGIVHRDLKPENIYVADTDDGELAKLLDFGIARVRSEGKNLTHTGSLMGTASYMATEQIAAGVGEIGPWSDVYAMGAILYEMLAGAPAFGGNTVTEVLQRVLKSECVPLASVRPGLPASVYALVDRCMSNQPVQRPQDAEAMRIALSAARLVPLGAPVPPPNKTKVDAAPPHSMTPGGTALGVMATEARETPLPKLTPAPATPAPQITPAAGNSAVVGSTSGVSAFGPTIGRTADATGNTTAPPAKPKSKLPLIIGGVAVVGIGAVVAAVALGGGGGDKKDKHRDAGVIAQVGHELDAAPVAVDAPIAIDAAPVAALPAFTKDMVHFAAGDHTLGEDPRPSPNALEKKAYPVIEFWIDKEEMTLGALRAALKDPKVGGLPGDSLAVPARKVAWVEAAAACKNLGKRLPLEYEWETAALSTPNNKAIAALKGDKAKLVPANHAGCTPDNCDCSADGLCDMLGGVLEWVADGPGDQKVVRGSGHTVSNKEGWMATIHFRQAVSPKADDEGEVGFRCAWDDTTCKFCQRSDAPKTGDAPKPDGPKPDGPKPDGPKPTPKPACADQETMFHAAREQLQAGAFAAAISKGEAAAACFPDDDRNLMTIGMGACRANNAAKAKFAFGKIEGRAKRNTLRQLCAREGIDL